MISNPELPDRGLALFETLYGTGAGGALVKNMEGLRLDFTDITIEWAIRGIISLIRLDHLTHEFSRDCVVGNGRACSSATSSSYPSRSKRRRDRRTGCRNRPAATVLCGRRSGPKCFDKC